MSSEQYLLQVGEIRQLVKAAGINKKMPSMHEQRQLVGASELVQQLWSLTALLGRVESVDVEQKCTLHSRQELISVVSPQSSGQKVQHMMDQIMDLQVHGSPTSSPTSSPSARSPSAKLRVEAQYESGSPIGGGDTGAATNVPAFGSTINAMQQWEQDTTSHTDVLVAQLRGTPLLLLLRACIDTVIVGCQSAADACVC